MKITLTYFLVLHQIVTKQTIKTNLKTSPFNTLYCKRVLGSFWTLTHTFERLSFVLKKPLKGCSGYNLLKF